jgi:hypothetical protein
MGVVVSHYERWLASACIGVAVTADENRPFSGPTYLLWEVSTSGGWRPFSGPPYLLWEVLTNTYGLQLQVNLALSLIHTHCSSLQHTLSLFSLMCLQRLSDNSFPHWSSLFLHWCGWHSITLRHCPPGTRLCGNTASHSSLVAWHLCRRGRDVFFCCL